MRALALSLLLLSACAPCGDGDERCNGNDIERCNVDEGAWETFASCAEGQACVDECVGMRPCCR